jgi:predicted  nucleic acid-binding Zn-ribbon protein/DNA-directed RNA polymerase subunit M/transcription elongation factor TFIIS
VYSCDDCSNSYYVPGQNSPLVINGGCPDCGGHLRPERDQPGGTESDGTYRDDFKQDGNGHNPLQEGILGDYKPSLKRDESFASVRSGYNTASPVQVRNDMSLSPSNQSPQMPWDHGTPAPDWGIHTAGPALALLPEAAEAIGGGAAAAGAGEAAGAGGGGLTGSIGGLMNGAMSMGASPNATALVRGLQGANAMHGLMNNGEQQSGSAGPIPAGQSQVQDYLSSTHTALDLPGGGTAGDFPKDTSDPEKIDSKEHNDSPEHLDDITGEQASSDEGGKDFDPHGPGVERFMMLLPLIQHYAEGDEDGSDDPLIQALHDILDAELPGYRDGDGHSPGSEHDVSLDHDDKQEIHDDGDHLEKESDPKESAMAPRMIGPVSPEEDALQSANWPKEAVETCPNCGNVAQMALGGCPHCGAQLHEYRPPHVGANHQGPHNPDQVAAVQQYLIDTGRVAEVPNVVKQPWEYAEEMAQVSNAVDAPPSEDMAASPPMPAQEETPPDAGMPVPGMSIPPGQSSVRTTADNATPVCPKCGSHTTGSDEEGNGSCHTCQHTWKAGDKLVEAKVAEHHHDHSPDNVQGAPAADQHAQPVLDSGVTEHWVTNDGHPLEEQQQYELHTPGIAIPDIVKIVQKKPDSIVLEFTGAHNMGFTKEVSRDEFNVEGYNFTPLRGLDQEQAQAPDQDEFQPAQEEFGNAGAGTDSSPHQVMTSWNLIEDKPKPRTVSQMVASRIASDPESEANPEPTGEEHPERAWLLGKTAGARYSPSEQRDLIDEDGVARNSDKLDLSNTHYERQMAVAGLDDIFGW